jgi:hypothetical protein
VCEGGADNADVVLSMLEPKVLELKVYNNVGDPEEVGLKDGKDGKQKVQRPDAHKNHVPTFLILGAKLSISRAGRGDCTLGDWLTSVPFSKNPAQCGGR